MSLDTTSHEYPKGRRFQWVWCWRWHFGLKRSTGSMGMIYRWRLHLGPLEVRRWTPNTEMRELIAARLAGGER